MCPTKLLPSLSGAEAKVLLYVTCGGDLSAPYTAIGRATGLNRHTVAQALKNLASRGVLENLAMGRSKIQDGAATQPGAQDSEVAENLPPASHPVMRWQKIRHKVAENLPLPDRRKNAAGKAQKGHVAENLPPPPPYNPPPIAIKGKKKIAIGADGKRTTQSGTLALSTVTADNVTVDNVVTAVTVDNLVTAGNSHPSLVGMGVNPGTYVDNGNPERKGDKVAIATGNVPRGTKPAGPGGRPPASPPGGGEVDPGAPDWPELAPLDPRGNVARVYEAYLRAIGITPTGKDLSRIAGETHRILVKLQAMGKTVSWFADFARWVSRNPFWARQYKHRHSLWRLLDSLAVSRYEEWVARHGPGEAQKRAQERRQAARVASIQPGIYKAPAGSPAPYVRIWGVRGEWVEVQWGDSPDDLGRRNLWRIEYVPMPFSPAEPVALPHDA